MQLVVPRPGDETGGLRDVSFSARSSGWEGGGDTPLTQAEGPSFASLLVCYLLPGFCSLILQPTAHVCSSSSPALLLLSSSSTHHPIWMDALLLYRIRLSLMLICIL